MLLDFQLSNGGAIQVWSNQVTIVDHCGTPVRFNDVGPQEIDDFLDLATPGSNGIRYVRSPNLVVVVAWINTEDNDAFIYVHTPDRSQALAPLYITARERRELSRR